MKEIKNDIRINNADEIIDAVEPFSSELDLEAFAIFKMELRGTKHRTNYNYFCYAAVLDTSSNSFVYISPLLIDLLGYPENELKKPGMLRELEYGNTNMLSKKLEKYGKCGGVPISLLHDFKHKNGTCVELWWRSIPGNENVYIWGIHEDHKKDTPDVPPFDNLEITKRISHEVVNKEYDILKELIESLKLKILNRNEDLFENPAHMNAISEQLRRFEQTILTESGADLAHIFDSRDRNEQAHTIIVIRGSLSYMDEDQEEGRKGVYCLG
jgi:hypothetical protein